MKQIISEDMLERIADALDESARYDAKTLVRELNKRSIVLVDWLGDGRGYELE